VMTPLDFPVISPEEAEAMLKQMASADHIKTFEKIKDADFSHEVAGLGRFRVNAHRQRQTIGITMRAIKTKIPPFESLGLPEVVQRLTYLPRGLVLVTGDTGSGKSTTLAAMIEAMNQRYRKHIITIEDPVEYAMPSANCIIEQRELGTDTPSFASGLRHVLRQDPDIILVGEMRDLETTAAAITAAETGHLVFSTLHTVNASQTVERIINYFPPHQHELIRMQLSMVLEGVVAQRLGIRKGGSGRVPAVELMLKSPSIRDMLREGRTTDLYKCMAESEYFGCMTFNQSIRKLYEDDLIALEDAMRLADNPEELKMELRGIMKGARATDFDFNF